MKPSCAICVLHCRHKGSFGDQDLISTVHEMGENLFFKPPVSVGLRWKLLLPRFLPSNVSNIYI